jgi:hypothetical protein
MRREDTLVAHGCDVCLRRRSGLSVRPALPQQRHSEQGAVALVHVIRLDAVVAQRPQHRHAAEAEHGLLAQPVARIAAVELSRKRRILGRVLRQVGVEHVDRHLVAADPTQPVQPRAQMHLASLQGQGHAFFEGRQEPLRLPLRRGFGLRSIRRNVLAKEPLAVQQRHGDDRHTEVGRRSQRVACQHPQAAAVSRHLRPQAYLHREISDAAIRGHGQPSGR